MEVDMLTSSFNSVLMGKSPINGGISASHA
jgi:hypothetical protein